MMISQSFLRSLLLASTFSFAAPLGLIGGIWLLLSITKQIPFVEAVSQAGAEKLLEFLAVFGSGDAVQGALVIGLTCGVVGALFDTYAFYRQHHLRDS